MQHQHGVHSSCPSPPAPALCCSTEGSRSADGERLPGITVLLWDCPVLQGEPGVQKG